MKKILAGFLVLTFFSSSVSLALTAAESEYKWNKLSIFTRYSTHVSGAMSMYEGTGSGSISSQDVENWYITRGGKTISEPQYLRLLGDNQKADEIIANNEAIASAATTWWIVSFAGVGYMFIDILDGNDQYYGVIIGAVAALGAMYFALTSVPPTHYLNYDEVGPQVDKYNAGLKVKLGLSADVDARL